MFQLYPTVYFHKATRGTEKLFTELLVRVVTLVRDNSVPATGLPQNHPLVRFAQFPEDIDVVLALDDTVIWGALAQMSAATDPLVAEFSIRIRDRKLFKCHDIRTRVTHILDPKSKNSEDEIEIIDRRCAEIGKKLTEWSTDKEGDRPRILIDADERSPYKPIDKSKGPLDRINIRTETNELVDLKERSSVVGALKTYKLFRAYVGREDVEAQSAVERIIQGEIEKCRL